MPTPEESARDYTEVERVAQAAAADESRASESDGPGRQFVGPYEIQERLGGGAMATVYRAVDRATGEAVALKVLLPSADATMRERFEREALLVRSLQHAHVVKTYQVAQTGGAEGIAYIAMQLVDGASLADLLEQHGRLAPADACRILAPVASALAYAHRQGIVHRDVKPANILLQRAPANTDDAVAVSLLVHPVVPLLSDFGIARALDAPELTSAGRTVGTPAFMAPEQCAGADDIDGRADIYSLGAVLYRCVVGRAPYSGTTTQILHAHVYDPLLVPEETARALPPEVLALVTRAMMKEPEQRFDSMDAMAKALQHCGDSLAAQHGDADDVDAADPTMTMAALPAMAPALQPAPRILVPATPVALRQVAKPKPTAVPSMPAVAPKPAAARSAGRLPRARVAATIVAATLVLLVAVTGATLVANVLPDRLAVTETRVTLPPTALMSDSGANAGGGSRPEMTAEAGAVGRPDGPAAAPVATVGPTPTPSPVPPPAVPIGSAWDDAQAFFAEREWQSALDWLTIVRRIDEEFEARRVSEMLATSYVGLATEAMVANRWEDAVTLLDEAVRLRPDAETISGLRAATRAFLAAGDAGRDAARRTLQAAHVAYAAAQDDAGDPCLAEEQIAAAQQIGPMVQLGDLEGQYRDACVAVASSAALGELGGSIIYSSQQGDSFGVFRLPVGAESGSSLLVEEAAQPRLAPDGRSLAYFSTDPDALGLFRFDLGVGLSTAERGLRLTEYGNDARDAPPSWNADASRVAFTSTRFGDGRYRAYLAAPDGSGDAVSLGYGKDPMWHPSEEMLVMNGTDETGNRPGLWLVRADGGGRTQLTDNGNDQRPVWSPDGRYIIFMSNGRDGNWEVYRYDTLDGSLFRLTDHPAQDGLPAVSPDGQFVAFMSDRDGYWRLWYVPLEGGEAQPLGAISGVLAKWLEHGIQWVP
jgi:hypothetical protein